MIAVELFNGTPAQANQYPSATGITYPLLLLGASPTGGNLTTLYGERDNFVVIDPDGIVRYHAQDLWRYNNRYHFQEIRNAVTAWAGGAVGVEPGSAARRFQLDATPNPFLDVANVSFFNAANEETHAEIAVYDLAGRKVDELWKGMAAPGWNQATWNAGSRQVPAGVYVVRATVGRVTLVRRIVRLK